MFAGISCQINSYAQNYCRNNTQDREGDFQTMAEFITLSQLVRSRICRQLCGCKRHWSKKTTNGRAG